MKLKKSMITNILVFVGGYFFKKKKYFIFSFFLLQRSFIVELNGSYDISISIYGSDRLVKLTRTAKKIVGISQVVLSVRGKRSSFP